MKPRTAHARKMKRKVNDGWDGESRDAKRSRENSLVDATPNQNITPVGVVRMSDMISDRISSPETTIMNNSCPSSPGETMLQANSIGTRPSRQRKVEDIYSSSQEEILSDTTTITTNTSPYDGSKHTSNCHGPTSSRNVCIMTQDTFSYHDETKANALSKVKIKCKTNKPKRRRQKKSIKFPFSPLALQPSRTKHHRACKDSRETTIGNNENMWISSRRLALDFDDESSVNETLNGCSSIKTMKCSEASPHIPQDQRCSMTQLSDEQVYIKPGKAPRYQVLFSSSQSDDDDDIDDRSILSLSLQRAEEENPPSKSGEYGINIVSYKMQQYKSILMDLCLCFRSYDQLPGCTKVLQSIVETFDSISNAFQSLNGNHDALTRRKNSIPEGSLIEMQMLIINETKHILNIVCQPEYYGHSWRVYILDCCLRLYLSRGKMDDLHNICEDELRNICTGKESHNASKEDHPLTSLLNDPTIISGLINVMMGLCDDANQSHYGSDQVMLIAVALFHVSSSRVADMIISPKDATSPSNTQSNISYLASKIPLLKTDQIKEVVLAFCIKIRFELLQNYEKPSAFEAIMLMNQSLHPIFIERMEYIDCHVPCSVQEKLYRGNQFRRTVEPQSFVDWCRECFIQIQYDEQRLVDKADNQTTIEANDDMCEKRKMEFKNIEFGSDFVLQNPQQMLTFEEDDRCDQQSPLPSTSTENTIRNLERESTAVEVTPYPSNHPARRMSDTIHNQNQEHQGKMTELSLSTLSAICCATNSHLDRGSPYLESPDEKDRQEIFQNVIELDKQLESAEFALGKVQRIYDNVSRSGLFHKSAIDTIHLGNTYNDVRSIANAWMNRRAAVEHSMASMLQERILGKNNL